MTAGNTGSVTANVTSDLVGNAHITAAKDDAVAKVTGAVLTVGGLIVKATTDTAYAATGKDARIDVTGVITAALDDVGVHLPRRRSARWR